MNEKIEFDLKPIENDKCLSFVYDMMLESFEDEQFSSELKSCLQNVDDSRVCSLSIPAATEFHQWLSSLLFHEFDYWSDENDFGVQQRRFVVPEMMIAFVKLNELGIELECSIKSDMWNPR